MSIETILNKIHKNISLTEEEYDYLYEKCFEDEDIYDVGENGNIFYQVIFRLGDEYYSAYRTRNDMWGSEWELTDGITRVYPKEIKTISWSTEEEK